MSTIKSQLEYTNDTKNLIKQEIIKKGVAVSEADTFRAYPQKIKEIQQGYPPKQTGQLLVTWFDYDGTVLKAKWYNYGDSVPESDFPKEMPKHDGLIFEEWNYTAADLSSVKRYYDIGAIYGTVSNNTRAVVYVNDVKDPVVINIHGGATIDWGDGSPIDSAKTAGSNADPVVFRHTYKNRGMHSIIIGKRTDIFLDIFRDTNLVSNNGAYLHELNLAGEANIYMGWRSIDSCLSVISFSKNWKNGQLSEVLVPSMVEFLAVPRTKGLDLAGATCLKFFSVSKNITIYAGNKRTYSLERAAADTVSLSGDEIFNVSCKILTGNAPTVGSQNAKRWNNLLMLDSSSHSGGELKVSAYANIIIVMFGAKMVNLSATTGNVDKRSRLYVDDTLVEWYRSNTLWRDSNISIFPVSELLKMQN